MHLGAGVGPAVGVSVLRGQGVGLPTVKVPFWPGVRRKFLELEKIVSTHFEFGKLRDFGLKKLEDFSGGTGGIHRKINR